MGFGKVRGATITRFMLIYMQEFTILLFEKVGLINDGAAPSVSEVGSGVELLTGVSTALCSVEPPCYSCNRAVRGSPCPG